MSQFKNRTLKDIMEISRVWLLPILCIRVGRYRTKLGAILPNPHPRDHICSVFVLKELCILSIKAFQ